MFTPRIIITGAGPGGLALARLLHLHGLSSTVLDLRSRPTPEEVQLPSGMLDLHEDTGLAAIRACGLEDEFNAAIGDCSEECKVYTPDGKLIHEDEGQGGNRPEIPRASLIDLLIRSLPDETIRWGSKVSAVRTEVTSTGATEVVVEMADGGEVRGDLLIGADGAWSKTRKLVTSAQPVYSGLIYITVTARHITTNYPHLVDICGSGGSFALGNGHGIMTHRGPMDSLRVYIAVKTPNENWAETVGLKGKSAEAVKEVVLGDPALFKDWAEELKEMIAIACDEDVKDGVNITADIKGIYTLPQDGSNWPSKAGVTILGDAAHLMAPNGEGVNSALADAMDLAKLIGEPVTAASAKEWQEAIAPRVREYEEVMQKRAKEVFAETEELLGIMHGENGAEALAAMFQSFGPPPEEGETEK